MPFDSVLVVAALAALFTFVAVVFVLRQAAEVGALRLLVQETVAGGRDEGETTRTVLAAAIQRAAAEGAERLAMTRGELATGIETIRTTLTREQGALMLMVETKLGEMRAATAEKLAEIQRSVNEQLHAAVEKQMTESFSRVVEQFAAVQKAMGDVQAVTAQIGDIKRLFANVKTRGGWGETQVRAMLDDILPAGAYETNVRVRAGSDDAVEFAVRMPARGDEARPWLPIDAKFPVEDYERLLEASEAGDAEAERAARAGLERRIRTEARKIADKYVSPPETVEFAVLYLPTDALFAEVARIPGLIDEIGRESRIVVLGPSLFPALLRTIHLGFVTLALEQKAGEVRALLGATRGEMVRMDQVLDRLGKQAGTFSNTIEQARTRTRAVSRKLKTVEALSPVEAARVLELEAEGAADDVSD
jgi:DNA recombination protein RmuC